MENIKAINCLLEKVVAGMFKMWLKGEEHLTKICQSIEMRRIWGTQTNEKGMKRVVGVAESEDFENYITS